ncbi:ABC transporter permease [Saccharophagus degradans]|uniref:ABC transporter permease n=1 Tax=Saccharophagus degradans TaxID=86304 RepID=A0AAW7XAJ9_9GAMM|nr:ABC transporter permease [Saccharophagus degradans]MDO6423379.1 ABC transporter permease [Saccharophagus degradans]MDO6606784.1 ABC transporter permease [Saccharophagus degradans]
MFMLKDIQFALRMLAKNLGFSALTVTVIALGIGLSVFLFSMFNTILFKDLPFKDGDRLIQINKFQNNNYVWGGLNLHDFEEVRSALNHLATFAAYQDTSVTVVSSDGARRFESVSAEAEFFGFTSTTPLIGRTFTPEETQTGNHLVAVINYDLWQNLYGGQPDILNKTIRLGSYSHQIIGVMPKGYAFPENASIWYPLTHKYQQITREHAPAVYGVGMLDKGVTAEQVNAALVPVMQRIALRHPKTNSGVTARVSSFALADMDNGIAVVYVLQIAAALILLLASINVGNLLFSRAVERNKETAIRVALGAPRYRLMSQLLWESAIICCIGGAIGFLLMGWGLDLTSAIVPTFFKDPLPFWWIFSIDAFTIQLFLSALLFTFLFAGVLPAWKSTSTDFNAVLRDGTRGAQSKGTSKLNKCLVVSEIFISLVILIAASTAVVGAYNASHADFGIDITNTTVAKVELDQTRYNTPEDRIAFVQKLQALLEADSSIAQVAFSTSLPGEWSAIHAVEIEGEEYQRDSLLNYPQVNFVRTTAGSLSKLGIGLKNGRYFNTGDDTLGKNTAIVSQRFAEQYFANSNSIGQRVKLHINSNKETDWLTIVGVVANTLQGAPENKQSEQPTIYRPFGQMPHFSTSVAIRSSADFKTTEAVLRSAIASIDTQLPAYYVQTYDALIKRLGAPLRFISSIFFVFGIAAVALSASGIYGVMANIISQKTQEIGVKRALGALDSRITNELLWRGTKQLLLGGLPGALIGCAMGYALAKVLAVPTTLILIVAALMITIVALVVVVAIYVPTRHALKMEPSDALRYE